MTNWMIVLLALVLLVGSGGCIEIVRYPERDYEAHEEQQSGESFDGSLEIEKGDPDWWKKQPDLKQEETAINNMLNQSSAALESKNIEQAVTYFSPGVSDKYRELFSTSPDIMPQMAAHLRSAKMSFLSGTGIGDARIAEYSLEVDGYTFYILLIKTDTQWLLKSL